jgi:hypothetical protein
MTRSAGRRTFRGVHRAAILATLGGVLLAGAAEARTLRMWTYTELMKAADLVVIATPRATTATGGLEELPNILESDATGKASTVKAEASRPRSEDRAAPHARASRRQAAAGRPGLCHLRSEAGAALPDVLRPRTGWPLRRGERPDRSEPGDRAAAAPTVAARECERLSMSGGRERRSPPDLIVRPPSNDPEVPSSRARERPRGTVTAEPDGVTMDSPSGR